MQVQQDVEWPKVAIIMLNWNGWQDTIECLESLYQITYNNYVVVIVDNDSDDESIERIKEYVIGNINIKSDCVNKPKKIIEYTREEATREGGDDDPCKRIIIIKNEKNYGFAEGNNIAMRYALRALKPDYFLLLNNDTVVEKGFLKEFVKFAESDPSIGFVGPKTYQYNFKGKSNIISFAGGKLSMWRGQAYHVGLNDIDGGQYDEIKEVDYVEGSCLFVRKELIEKIGLLNENYFAYWEEVDLIIRGQRAGYKSIYYPNAKIWHKELSSARKINGFHEYQTTRNMFWFMKQHATKTQLFFFIIYFFGYRFWLKSSFYIVYRRDVSRFISFYKGIVDGIKGVQR